jgi:hypothetical protein
MGFSEQLNNDPCDLRSQERLIYADECEHTQEAVMDPPSMDRETAVPITEKTPSGEKLPSNTPPVRTPIVDPGQAQAYSTISINRIDVHVLTREKSTPGSDGWKKRSLNLLDKTDAIIALVLQ